MRKTLAVPISIAIVAIGAALLLGSAWDLQPSWTDLLPASVILLAAVAAWWRGSRRTQRN